MLPHGRVTRNYLAPKMRIRKQPIRLMIYDDFRASQAMKIPLGTPALQAPGLAALEGASSSLIP